MKYYLTLMLLVGLYACQSTTAQGPDKSVEEDAEFENLLKKVNENNQLSLIVQAQAAQSQTKIVEQSVENIIELKSENINLKVELNEVKTKLDSVSNDTGVSYIILPISNHKKNR